jgi:hypothetical protein
VQKQTTNHFLLIAHRKRRACCDREARGMVLSD